MQSKRTPACTRTSARAITLTTAVLAGLSLAGSSAAQRGRDTPSARPSLEHLTFAEEELDSTALGQKVPYGVFLPKDYGTEQNAEVRYPLLIWLHGLNEDHMRFQRRGGAAILDALCGSGDVPPMIFVCANGGHSFYIDGQGDHNAWETMITKDLVEHLEKTYRVREGRENRVLAGVSMGGYGALKIALSHPDRFGVVVAHSAAILPRDPDQLEEVFPWIKQWGGARRMTDRIFGDPIDREKWQAENVLEIADRLDRQDLDGMKIYFDCGHKDRYGFDVPNKQLHEVLEKKKVPHTWRLVENGQHGWQSGYNQDALPHSLRFCAAAFSVDAGKAGLRGLFGGPSGPSDGGKSKK